MITFLDALLEKDSSLVRRIYLSMLANIDLKFWYSITDDLEEYDNTLATLIRNILSGKNLGNLTSDLHRMKTKLLPWHIFYTNHYHKYLLLRRASRDSEDILRYEWDTNTWSGDYTLNDDSTPEVVITAGKVPTQCLKLAIIEIISTRSRII